MFAAHIAGVVKETRSVEPFRTGFAKDLDNCFRIRLCNLTGIYSAASLNGCCPEHIRMGGIDRIFQCPIKCGAGNLESLHHLHPYRCW